MSIEEKLQNCEKVLGEDDVDDPEFEKRTVETSKKKLEVLSLVVERLCLDVKSRTGSDMTFAGVMQIEGVFSAIESISKSLKPLGRHLSNDTVKELAEDRRGSFKTLSINVSNNVLHPDPAQSIFIPVLRHIVGALSELNTALEA